MFRVGRDLDDRDSDDRDHDSVASAETVAERFALGHSSGKSAHPGRAIPAIRPTGPVLDSDISARPPPAPRPAGAYS